uniref:Uncharacterized protein n=1 Tax=Trichogramma kaykai TaxID=54128 RepID=A0ABD2XKK0_9HYME
MVFSRHLESEKGSKNGNHLILNVKSVNQSFKQNQSLNCFVTYISRMYILSINYYESIITTDDRSLKF